MDSPNTSLARFAELGVQEARGDPSREGAGAAPASEAAGSGTAAACTVRVKDLLPRVQEAQLWDLFARCGEVVDCRLCGGSAPSEQRFAFVEFASPHAAGRAVALTGQLPGGWGAPLSVEFARSSMVSATTATTSINPKLLLPHTSEERSRCRRTVHVANLSPTVGESEIWDHFTRVCGRVTSLNLHRSGGSGGGGGGGGHSTGLAFVEFASPEGAARALLCTGQLLGGLAIRVSPSKLPVAAAASASLEPHHHHHRRLHLAAADTAAPQPLATILTNTPAWEQQPRLPRQETQSAVTVHVSNVSSSAGELQLVRFFERRTGGPVKAVRLISPAGGASATTTKAALVTFADQAHAVTALALDGASYLDAPIQVVPSRWPLREEPAKATTMTASGSRVRGVPPTPSLPPAPASASAPVQELPPARRHQRARRRNHQPSDAGPGGEPATPHFTVYVKNVDEAATEADLAALFAQCGELVDVRLCAAPEMGARFAFIEFATCSGYERAMEMSGTAFRGHQVVVERSKTGMVPVDPKFLPQTPAELEQCQRTVYVTRLDPALSADAVRGFFESACGSVAALQLNRNTPGVSRANASAASSRHIVAFVEFRHPSAAAAALACSGYVLGEAGFAIRVSPSKTPLKPSLPRSTGANNNNNSNKR
mmetsp:Transcript_8109/g.26962  ORF Transcript_8109/g.26962 Transcript_8109/m.26962 type:complete len:657 (-) Transcript_8109:301-2271(-)